MQIKVLALQFLKSQRQFQLHRIFAQRRSYAGRAYVHRIGEEPLRYRNLGEQLLSTADRYGERTALIAHQENETLTYAEALNEAEKLAIALKDLGLEKGDHLGLWAPNTRQWCITFMASMLAGFPVVCLNPVLQAPELEYALKKAKVKALITMDKCGEKLKFSKILSELFGDDKNVKFPDLKFVLMKSEGSKAPTYAHLSYDDTLLKIAEPHRVKELLSKVTEISPEASSVLQFTSGTTGLPKVALLNHFNFVNESYHCARALRMIDAQQRVCLTVPLFHVFGLAAAVGTFLHGSTLVLPSQTYSAAAALDAVEQESCSVLLGTPTMFVDMLEQQRRKVRSVESLKIGLVGGAACSPEVYTQTKEVFNLDEMRIAYGLTESCAIIFAQNGNESVEEASQTVGKLCEHLEAKVVNEKGETVAFGESGQLCIRGHLVMQGYYEDEAKTRETITSDGWLKTGDEFALDASGVGRIMGRKKDLIIRGGENIFPKEVEDFLDTHESILEAQVIGIPDERLGEEVCAYLRLRPGAKPLTESDIKEFCKGKVAYFKTPRYVRIIEQFPKTNSGKIQKFKLREMFEATENK